MAAVRHRIQAVCTLLPGIWASWLVADRALAEQRVAPIIGNSAYENVARSGNPANDATAMTTTLQQAGFDVVDSRRDLNIADMRRAKIYRTEEYARRWCSRRPAC